jgi:hypothetical protein
VKSAIVVLRVRVILLSQNVDVFLYMANWCTTQWLNFLLRVSRVCFN